MTANTIVSTPIAVVGAGSWGTALAIQLARCGNPTKLWGRDPTAIAQMASQRVNSRYLPDAKFPEKLIPVADFAECVSGCDDILVAVPSHAFRETLEQLKPLTSPTTRIVWATKGLERHTGEFLSVLCEEVLGARPMAIISGPTFAKEVAAGLPAAVAVASPDPKFASDLVARLHGHGFRAYTNSDIIGVQIGGAVKNVLAVAAGIADGLELGANTRAGMITRGLNETMRLGNAVGARQETFMGLAGLGDLILTCTDNLSRNRRFGLCLARGLSSEEAQAEIQQVVEGLFTTDEVWRLAQKHNVEMPIVEEVYAVLFKGRSPMDAVQALVNRAPKEEMAGTSG